MPWDGVGQARVSTRAWRTTRLRILKRDRGICHVCRGKGADQVDHVKPAWAGGTDDDDNLAAIHQDPCHRTKSAREATAARAAKPSARRPAERHPGLL